MPANNILLVEDNPDDEALTLRALKNHSLINEVTVARDGQEAVDFLLFQGNHENRSHALNPVLVLLDLQLPKLDGFAVLKRLRADERTKFLPVVILTSSSEQEDILSSYGLGANSYIRKPVDFNQFIDTVAQLAPYWLEINQPAEMLC
jgi:CheY-like chemotaxis protein